jgi:hypothetical protein
MKYLYCLACGRKLEAEEKKYPFNQKGRPTVAWSGYCPTHETRFYWWENDQGDGVMVGATFPEKPAGAVK